MDSLSPTENRVSNPLVRGFLSWWHTRPPQDEPSRRQWAHKFIDRHARITLPICLLALASGAFFRPLAWWQVLVMCFCGVLDTASMLKGLRGYGQWSVFLASGPLTVVVVAPTGNYAEHFLHSLSITIYAALCAFGTISLLCRLFREPFLRYVETPAEPTPNRFLSPPQDSAIYTFTSPVPQKFDY